MFETVQVKQQSGIIFPSIHGLAMLFQTETFQNFRFIEGKLPLALALETDHVVCMQTRQNRCDGWPFRLIIQISFC